MYFDEMCFIHRKRSGLIWSFPVTGGKPMREWNDLDGFSFNFLLCHEIRDDYLVISTRQNKITSGTGSTRSCFPYDPDTTSALFCWWVTYFLYPLWRTAFPACIEAPDISSNGAIDPLHLRGSSIHPLRFPPRPEGPGGLRP